VSETLSGVHKVKKSYMCIEVHIIAAQAHIKYLTTLELVWAGSLGYWVTILLEKVLGVVETVDWKLSYICEDFQDYKLQHAAWRQVAIG